MAVMSYRDWLDMHSKASRRQVMSTPGMAAIYRQWVARQTPTPAAPATTTPATAAPAPDANVSTAMTPDDFNAALMKDPQAILDVSGAQQDFATRNANATANWQNAKNQLAAQLPQFQHNLEMGRLAATNAGAARGTAQSGQTELGKQQAQTDYTNQVAQNQLQGQAADTAYQGEMGQNASDLNLRAGGAFRDAGTRFRQNQLEDFSNTYGINSGIGANLPNPTNSIQPPPAAAIAPAAAKPKPVPGTATLTMQPVRKRKPISTSLAGAAMRRVGGP